MSDPEMTPLTWQQWGAILLPLHVLVMLWMRWCLRRSMPAPPRTRRQKETPK